MKIAIVAPCPVPYVVGGQEKLWWGLASYFNEATSHQCEIIKLPSPEHNLLSLLRSYEAFSSLDLGGFDMVISGKYPAWMVSHENHVCYMLHRLRGLYDAYSGPTDISGELMAHSGVRSLCDFMRKYYGIRSAVSEFFARWNELALGGQLPAGLLDFPGPLARILVHWLDGVALSPDSIRRYASISSTVADRPGYFPEGVAVAVAYPPPHRALLPAGESTYFLTASRLDGPKRVSLIIDAMRKVRTEIPLLIVGTGPEEERLRDLAKGDPRIRFLGFVGDNELASLYSDTLAVPFVPYQEDYGLITVEAMQAGKPVITTNDSGGPRELIKDGQSGFVCEPTAEALAACMQRYADDPSLALAMGSVARDQASSITWAKVCSVLLDNSPKEVVSHAITGAKRRKLLVASTFSIFPPRHGGQSRIFHFYRALAPDFETVIVSLCRSKEPAFSGEIAPGVREVRIPLSEKHERRDAEMQAAIGVPITDVIMPELFALTPAIRKALEEEARDACVAIASHPYLYPALTNLGLPIWYEAHNLEYELKTKLLEDRPGGKKLLASVFSVEKAAVQASELILCASSNDAEGLVRLFNADPKNLLNVPNGTDTSRITFTGLPQRNALKARLDLENTPAAIFMGSGHWPNIEAVKHVFSFAGKLPEFAFLVVGSVCYAFDPNLKPPNVLFLGEVDDIARNLCLQISDVALNPMEHGSGTNLKMLDFFAAGLPVISTDCGSRGLSLTQEQQCLVREIAEFPSAIKEVFADAGISAAKRAKEARTLAEDLFDWDAIARRVKPRLIEAADRNR